MTGPILPPAINGTEQRLDELIAELRALRDVLAPGSARLAAAPGPETIELREPERPERLATDRPTPATGRRGRRR